MSILEQVLALGQQLTPEERAEITRTWLLQDWPTPQLSPETERILNEALGRIQRGEAVFYTSEEVFDQLQAAQAKGRR